MAKNASVLKSISINRRNRLQSKVYKSTIKTLTKKLLLEIENANKTESQATLSILYSHIDKAVKKGVIHKNNAARRKSSLSKKLLKI
uniref:Small ribosomal subunit protein bS20c n=1 Tax=Yamadaella caenomyce TaxID=259029 RepID=A0A1G4NYM3_9FLOR|nr:Ribosomal protein S20 [Yamadaella caenomyce]SCW23801.1 Ribosomal protein S20 [Yamadaella caenomyce]